MSGATVREVLADLRHVVLDHGQGQITAFGDGATTFLSRARGGAWYVTVRRPGSAQRSSFWAETRTQLERGLEDALAPEPAGTP